MAIKTAAEKNIFVSRMKIENNSGSPGLSFEDFSEIRREDYKGSGGWVLKKANGETLLSNGGIPLPLLNDLVDQNRHLSGPLEISGTAYGGGSAYCIQTEAGKYLVTVRRDSGTRIFPNTLDILSGYGDTDKPLFTLFREATEEVIMIKNGTVMIPVIKGSPLSEYNDAVAENFVSLTVEFSQKHANIRAATQMPLQLLGIRPRYWYSLNGVPVSLNFTTKMVKWYGAEHDVADVPVVCLPFMAFNMTEKELSQMAYRETLEVETRGSIPERDVVVLHLNSGASKVFKKGNLSASYPDLGALVREEKLEKEKPFSLDMAYGLHVAGFKDVSPEITQMLRGYQYK